MGVGRPRADTGSPGSPRHVSSSGRVRVLVTSLDEKTATAAELGGLYHGRWRIEEAFKRLKRKRLANPY